MDVVVHLGALPHGNERLLREGADAQRGSVPSSRVIFCVALCVLKQYCGWPLAQARHSPQTARQFRITRSSGANCVTSGPTAPTAPVASWPSKYWKSSPRPPCSVMQVRVANPARENVHQGLPRPRIRDQNSLQRNRGILLPGDDCLYFMDHYSCVPFLDPPGSGESAPSANLTDALGFQLLGYPVPLSGDQ